MAPLTSLPLEIILQVYEESETFTDAVSLSSCCIRLRLIWKENQDVLAFKIALKTIPAFDNALITIRATAAAKSNLVNYILNEETPAEPVLIPPSFSYHVSKPKFPETLSVLSLFTLIDCALYLAQYGHPDHLRKLGCKLENETWRQGVPYVILPNDKESSYAHRYVVFSGMYRVFLAGAILSWAHIYPIVKEDSPVRERFLPDPIRPRFNIAANATSEMPHISPNIELNQAEITYLKKFLPFQLYNLGNSNSPNPIRVDDFRPLAEYLIQKGREDFELDDLGPPGYKETFVEITVEDHKQGSVIQQFLMLQNAYEILRRVIADKFLYDSHMDRTEYYPEPSDPNSEKRDKFGKLVGKKNLQLELFMFGCYQPEIFTFPSSKRWMEPTTTIYVEPGTCEGPSSESYSWDTMPITKLINNVYPTPNDARSNYIKLGVDSYFTSFCLQRFLRVGVAINNWFHQNSVLRVLFMVEGRGFRQTRRFVPKSELLGYPLHVL